MVRYAGSSADFTERKGTLPVSASSYRPKKKKQSGWMSNLWDDVKDLKHIPGGLWSLAKSSGHDIGKTATIAFAPNLFGEYQVDDIAKAIANDYKYTYGPALSGDFETTGKRIKEHPLGPILDVLTVVTGGAGAAAKGLKVAGKAGGSEKLLKAAGYEKATANDLLVSRYSPKRGHRVADAELTTKLLDRMNRDAPDVMQKIESGDFKGVLDDPIIGSILESNRFFADKSGTVWKPKSMSFDVGGGGAKYQFDLAENPIKRMRQGAFGKLGATKHLRDKPLIGVERRASKQSRTMMQAARIRESRGLEDVGENLRGLEDWDKDNAYGLLQSAELASEGRGRQVAAYDKRVLEKEQRGLLELQRREGLRDRKLEKVTRLEGVIAKQRAWAEKNPAKAEMHSSRAAKNVARLDAARAVIEKHNKVIEGIKKQKEAGVLGRKRKKVDGTPIISTRELRIRGELARLDDPKFIARAAQLEHGGDSKQFADAIEGLDEKTVKYLTSTEGQYRRLLEAMVRHEREKVTPAASEFGERKAAALGKSARDIETTRSRMKPLIISDRFADNELEALRRVFEKTENPRTLAKIKKVLETIPSKFDSSRSIWELAEQTVGEEVARLNRLNLGDFEIDRPVILTDKLLTSSDPLSMRQHAGGGAKKGHINETEYLNVRDARSVWSVEHAIQAMDAIVRNVFYQRMFVNALGRAKRVKHGENIDGHVKLYSDGKPSALATTLERLKEFFDEDATVLSGGELPENTAELLKMLEYVTAPEKGIDILIPKHVYDDLFPQARSSQSFLARGYRGLNRLWRAWVLGARPAWAVGNLVGNFLLMTLSLGALGTVKSLLAAPKHAKFLDEAFPDIMRVSLSDDVMRDIMRHAARGESLEEGTMRALFRDPKKWAEYRAKNKGQTVLDAALLPELGIKWNAKLIDNPMRRALFWGVLKPHVKRMQKKAKAQGIDLEAGDAARVLLADQRIFDEVAQRTLTDLVNYRDMNEFERKYIKAALPFYSWIKGITVTTAKNTLDKPGRYNVLFNWLAGYGEQLGEDTFADMPDWLQEYLSVRGDGKAVSVQAMNPWGTVAGVSGYLAPSVATEGMSPLASLGPLPKSVFEGMTRKDLLTGGETWETNPYRGGDPDMTRQGLIARRLVGSFPQYRLGESVLGGGARSDRGALAPRTGRQEALRYLTGVDVRDVNRANARAALIREELRRRKDEQENERVALQQAWREERGRG